MRLDSPTIVTTSAAMVNRDPLSGAQETNQPDLKGPGLELIQRQRSQANSVAAKLKAQSGELFADFHERSHTKVLAFQQVVPSVRNQLAYGIDAEPIHALASPDRQIEF